MSDPVATITSLLQPVFAGLNGGDPADPTVRASDRADAQINGALALAKRLGLNPRDVAQADRRFGGARRRGRRPGDRRPGLRQRHVLADVPGRAARHRGRRRSTRGGGRAATSNRDRRLLGAERGQGDARRPPAHHRDRRRAGPHALVPRPHGDPREPHRRLGTPVRDAHRAPPRHRRGRRRRRPATGRPRRLLQAGQRQVHRVGGVPGARPRTGRAPAAPRSGHPGDLGTARVDVQRATSTSCTASSGCCSPTTTSQARASTSC